MLSVVSNIYKPGLARLCCGINPQVHWLPQQVYFLLTQSSQEIWGPLWGGSKYMYQAVSIFQLISKQGLNNQRSRREGIMENFYGSSMN